MYREPPGAEHHSKGKTKQKKMNGWGVTVAGTKGCVSGLATLASEGL